MSTAKIFQHGGSQAVRLPKAFRFEGSEVLIEKRGQEVVLKAKPKPKFKTLNDVARYFAEKYPEAVDFPDPPTRPRQHERPILEW
jgi:antitoxin VapB